MDGTDGIPALQKKGDGTRPRSRQYARAGLINRTPRGIAADYSTATRNVRPPRLPFLVAARLGTDCIRGAGRFFYKTRAFAVRERRRLPHMPKLSTSARNKLPDSAFAGPGRSYPVPDAAHAANAKARAAQQRAAGRLSSSEEASIDAKANSVLASKHRKQHAPGA